ncbi:hypothetical protein T265_02463 [Opisthorchis viverrini]|uniref:Uncharacterized protein n=1 Tax=Opisthorchis viverrini TaxID=6198 RepID=A0A075A6L3_OPIVI|nr:hypothetical protein T265_02463 [Opisthorchis viverrini]KER31280.1 hypothetical protein T265_02463 [Opisthorchis viverrini]
MGNKTVKPQDNSRSVDAETVNVYLGTNPSNMATVSDQFAPCLHARARQRQTTKRRNRYAPHPAVSQQIQSNVFPDPIRDKACWNYPAQQQLNPIVRCSNVVPLTARQNRTPTVPRPTQKGTNSNANLCTSQCPRNPTNSSARRHLRSEMGTHQSDAKLFRLTGLDEEPIRKVESSMAYLGSSCDQTTSNKNSLVYSDEGKKFGTPNTPTILALSPSLRRLTELLEEFSSLFLIIPDDFQGLGDQLLDVRAITSRSVGELQTTVDLLQTNLGAVSNIIPLLNQHLVTAQELYHALHRLEERMSTFHRLIQQLSQWSIRPKSLKSSK